MSMCGAKVGLFLPRRYWATRVASRPSVWPLASTMYHWRPASASAAVGVYVLVFILSLSPSKGFRGRLGQTPKTPDREQPCQPKYSNIQPTEGTGPAVW